MVLLCVFVCVWSVTMVTLEKLYTVTGFLQADATAT